MRNLKSSLIILVIGFFIACLYMPIKHSNMSFNGFKALVIPKGAPLPSPAKTRMAIFEQKALNGKGSLTVGEFTEADQADHAISHYQIIKQDGGFTKIAKGKTIKPKMKEKNPKQASIQAERVNQIKQRLKEEGYLKHAEMNGVYDAATIEAVKHFQRTHGLKEDGGVGGNTLKAFNIKIECKT